MKVHVRFRLNAPDAPKLLSPARTPNYIAGSQYANHGGFAVGHDPEPGPILELWRFFWRNPWKIGIAALLGIAAAAAYTLPQTKVYEATATLEIQEMNENFMDVKDALPISEGNPTAALSGIQTQLRILTSNTLLERVLNKLPPEQAPPPSKVQEVMCRIAGSAAGGGGTRETDRIALLEHAGDNLRVKEARLTRIVDVAYDSPDPRYAADFVNTLSQEYIEQNVEARWKMSQRTAEWLSRQLGEMRKKLADSESRLQTYAHRSGLLFTAEKQNPSEERLRQVQAALSKAQEDRMARQATLETSQNAAPEALAEVLDDVSLRDYQNKLTDLRRQRAELSTVFKPNFDMVKRLDAQIATLETALKNERAAVLQRIRNDYESAVRREKLLDTSYTAQTEVVSAEGERAVQYGILQREADSNRQLYELMLHRVNEASIASAMRASNVRVIDPATPPRSPYKPSLALNLIWGLSAGMLAGVAIAVISERADRRIRKPGDLGFYLSVPELGVVPTATGSRGAQLGYYQGTLTAVDYDLEGATVSAPAVSKPVSGQEQTCVELVAWQQRSSMMAESFRGILTSILLANGEGHAPKVVVITSAVPGEGKSTVASNMAAALARIGKRVLLIDADLRRPRLHDIFHVTQDYGLYDLLTSGAEEYHDLLPYLIQETSLPGVFLLVGGPGAANATDLLYSETMADVVRQARESFDMVVIDTPPILELPDARVLGRTADGVVLVVRADTTTRDVALTVKQRLQEDGITILGTVLNNWIPR
jgi:polysaccharide biosynthesis transport protein